MNNFLKLAYEAGAQQAIAEQRREKTAFLEGLGELYDDAVDATARGIGNVADFYNKSVDSASRGIGYLDRALGSPIAGQPAVSLGNRGFSKYQDTKQKNMLVAARRQLQEMQPGNLDDMREYVRIRDQLVNNPYRGTQAATADNIDRFALTDNPTSFFGFGKPGGRTTRDLWPGIYGDFSGYGRFR